MPNNSNSDHATLLANLTTSLKTKYPYLNHVSQPWLSTFLASQLSRSASSTSTAPPPPLPALTSTAHIRFLHSDLTSSLNSDALSREGLLLPQNVNDVNVKERGVITQRPNEPTSKGIVVQVLDIQDIGSSKWSQVESLDRIAAGEEVRGREVIRVVDVDAHERGVDGPGGGPGGASTATRTGTGATGANRTKTTSGPHKLLLQDSHGTTVSAFELETVPKIGIGMHESEAAGIAIGAKILLKPGAVVRRGVVMLRVEDCVVLGGKVEGWEKSWRERWRARLVEGSSGGPGAGTD